MTLIPPPVDPALAPTNIRETSTALGIKLHRSKSAVEKPVVVWTEATWNALCLSASPTPISRVSPVISVPVLPKMQTAMIRVAASRKPR